MYMICQTMIHIKATGEIKKLE